MLTVKRGVPKNLPLPGVCGSPALPIDCQHIEGICDSKLPSQDSMCQVAVAIVNFKTSFQHPMQMIEHQSQGLGLIIFSTISAIIAVSIHVSPDGLFDIGINGPRREHRLPDQVSAVSEARRTRPQPRVHHWSIDLREFFKISYPVIFWSFWVSCGSDCNIGLPRASPTKADA